MHIRVDTVFAVANANVADVANANKKNVTKKKNNINKNVINVHDKLLNLYLVVHSFCTKH